MIVKRLLRAAMKAGGVVDIQDEIDAVEYEDALESCNMMLRAWATKGVITHHVVSEEFTLTAGQSRYTIGTGGDFSTSRPNRVTGAYLRDSNDVDWPLEIVARDDYNAIPLKASTVRPTMLYVYPTYPLSALVFDSLPDQAYTLFLDSLKPLTELALESELNMPPEYEEAIKWNLAVRLAPDYKQPVRPEVAALAEQAYRSLSIQPIPAAVFDGVPGTAYQPTDINYI